MIYLTLAALDLARLHGRRRLRCGGATRNNPQLNTVVLAETTVHNHESGSVDAALRDEVISRTTHQLLDLAHRAHPATVSNDVSARARIVLQLDREIVETRFLIVKGAVVTLVKLTSNNRYLLDRRDNRHCLGSLST